MSAASVMLDSTHVTGILLLQQHAALTLLLGADIIATADMLWHLTHSHVSISCDGARWSHACCL